MSWTPTGLCQTHILGHCWEVWNGSWAAVPTGTLWVGGPHEWPYLRGTGLAIVPRGGLITCVLTLLLKFVLLL